ncbi:MAG: VWA domain-containing protein [Myxococcales bacterium]|nr:VWA domain-containing protein [Polyangiaceae bacterium]MDW8248377.1 VWA domain-containing protein [Myxococcales bacterium]
MIRPLEEFFWTLRRHGFSFGPAQAADAIRAVALVGWEDRGQLREALALVLLRSASERSRFDGLFDAFFRAEKAHARDPFRRLVDRGASEEESATLRGLLEALSGEAGAAGEAARMLLGLAPEVLDGRLASAEARAMLAGLTSRRQVGFFAQQLLKLLGMGRAHGQLAQLQGLLEAEFGEERGARLMELLREELDRCRSEVRLAVEQEARVREEALGQGRSFEGLPAGEVEEVRQAVRVLGEKLRGAAQVRARRSRQGRVDARKTLRASMRWGGVPIRLLRRKKARRKPRLWVLCDVSESVRIASVFLLEFVAVTQELFEGTRTFVFVSDVAETTGLFAARPLEQALAAVLGGGAVSVAKNSNYGRALRDFEARYGRAIDRRSTVVLVGDGRTNYGDAAVEVVERLRERARALLWLCPEPASRWGTGDSAMPRYARAATEVLEATTARQLEEAARALVRRR